MRIKVLIYVLVILVCVASLSSGCSKYGKHDARDVFGIGSADLNAFCLEYTGCIDNNVGFGECIYDLMAVREGTRWAVTSIEIQPQLMIAINRIECFSAASTSCNELATCLGFSPNDTCRSTKASCKNNSSMDVCVLSRKLGWLSAVYNCGDIGFRCQEEPNYHLTSYCGESPRSLGEKRFVRCERGDIAIIDNGVERVGVDCRKYGAVCNRDEAGSDLEYGSICKGDGEACSDDVDEIRCEGDKIVSCFSGKRSVFDCALIGQTCSGSHGLYNVFCSPAECHPLSYGDHCDGDMLYYCSESGVDSLDCVQAGFEGCTDARFSVCEPGG